MIQEQLSEEDLVIQERINRLMSDVTELVSLQKNVHFRSLYANRYDTQSLKNGRSNRPKGSKQKVNQQLTSLVIAGSTTEHQMLLPTVDDQTNRHPSKILLSGVQRTWEEQSNGKIIEEVDGISLAPEQSRSEMSAPRRCSYESNGSAISGLSSSSSNTCVVIVTEPSEQDEDFAHPLPAHPTSSTQTEDDVFLSQ